MNGKYYYVGPPSDGNYSKEIPPFRGGEEVSVINTNYGGGVVYVSIEGCGKTFPVRIEWLSKNPQDKPIISEESLKKMLFKHLDDAGKMPPFSISPTMEITSQPEYKKTNALILHRMAEILESGLSSVVKFEYSINTNKEDRQISLNIEIVDRAGGEHE